MGRECLKITKVERTYFMYGPKKLKAMSMMFFLLLNSISYLFLVHLLLTLSKLSLNTIWSWHKFWGGSFTSPWKQDVSWRYISLLNVQFKFHVQKILLYENFFGKSQDYHAMSWKLVEVSPWQIKSSLLQLRTTHQNAVRPGAITNYYTNYFSNMLLGCIYI